MYILSCGVGMQSMALALMSCENAIKAASEYQNLTSDFEVDFKPVHPCVPVYDAIIFVDLGNEPPWVYDQVAFVQKACLGSGIKFYRLENNLYNDFITRFGRKRISSIPFWSLAADGSKAKMRRHCTIDYKILYIQQFVRYELLGYRKGERSRAADIGAHEMHIGFSKEEQRRVSNSSHPFFISKYPLIEMGYERSDTYKYILEAWGVDSRASACGFCPFHTNYFFQYIKKEYPEYYQSVIKVDQLLETEQPNTKINSKLFVSRSRKRIDKLEPEECNDGQFFYYGEKKVWNGF